MPTERHETDDPTAAENVRLKSENAALKRKLAKYEADAKLALATPGGGKPRPTAPRTLDPKAASAMNRPWDGR